MFVAFFIDCLLACLIENASFSLNLSCVKVFSTTCAGKQAMSKGALDPYDSHCEWNGNDYDKSKEEWLLTDLCHPILRRLVLKTMLLFKNHVSRRRGTLCDMVKAGAKKLLNRRLERLDYSHECWRFKEKNDGSQKNQSIESRRITEESQYNRITTDHFRRITVLYVSHEY